MLKQKLTNWVKFVVLFFLALLTIFPSAASAVDLYRTLETPFYDAGSSASCSNDSTVNIVGSDNIQKALNFLVGKGLTITQAAAIIGNLEQESGQGLDPSALNPKSGAYGIGQWLGGRLTTLQSLPNYNTLGTQINFLWDEITVGSEKDDGALAALKKDNSIEQMVFDWENLFERAGEKLGSVPMNNRIDNAKLVLQHYGSGVTASTSGCSAASVNCSNGSSNNALSGVRQNVVCIAEQELALWKSKPGYPHPSFSQSGYLKYSQNRPEEWCADFATWVYDQAKYPLQPDPNWNIAYVPNIQSVGEHGGNFHWHPGSSGYIPKPGDLAIHGPNHVNIFISSQGSATQYIGGDQGDGPYPGGSIVSIETGSGYYDNGITGYVSPD